ncbi:hypothetical protein KAR91_49860 [Candidatus Pacearchaeota archaeon]|nr:hypothetical protein [Candidatus Pacearchaeota archaeon]
MIVIGLNGKKQTGKDSVANLAEEILPGEVARISFAYPLKMFCVNYLGIPEKNCFGSDFEKDQWVGSWGEVFGKPALLEKYGKKPEDAISGREVLQVVGTDVFRENLNTNIWVDILTKRLADQQWDKPISGQAKVVFITDVRFPNEVEYLTNAKYRSIRLYRYTGKSESIEHASESVFDDIDDSLFTYLIDPQQNTSMSMLKKQVIQILNAEGLMDAVCD